MADSMLNRTAPFLAAAERSRIIGSERASLSDGVYRVLATLTSGDTSYRIFAELLVDDGEAQLRFHRFEAPAKSDWFADQKVNVPLTRSDIAPLEQKISGAEFVLCAPVRLDEVRSQAVFGSSVHPGI